MVKPVGHAEASVDAGVVLRWYCFDTARLHEAEEFAVATVEECVADTPPFLEIDLLDGHEAEAEHTFVESSGGIKVERGKADV